MSIQNAMTIEANRNAVQINEVSLSKGVLYKHKSLLKNVKCWHKFLVKNTDGLSRNEILKAILDHVHPLDLIPVFYAKDPTNSYSYFLARNCESAIEKLCKDNLVINHSYNKNLASQNFKPFKLSIMLNFANTNEVKIDVQKNVLAVLSKRFDITSKILNLDRFHEDPELSEFCPLSQPKIMYFILHIAKNLAPEEIILSNNGIKLLNPLDVLIGLKLKRIDLSNNELTSLNDLSSLKHFQLKELKLTGNPLCNCEEEVYISEVRQLCSTVQILDGVLVNMDKFPVTKRYSFCDYEGTDLVNQFLEYFFTIYDSSDRRALGGLYHSNAMFSLTCVYLNGQLSSANAYLKLYSNISRNLKKAADLSRTSEYLFQDRENIMDVFATNLPSTEHDPYSFTADLMCKTDSYAVIVVTGVFHEKPMTLLDKERFLGFTRSFALQLYDSNYVITNDQLHIYNGLTHQERNSFLEAVEPTKIVHKPLIPKPQANEDFIDLIATFSHLTNLKGEWSRKCLEECSYDLKASLELFVELYKADKIPQNGFIEASFENHESYSPPKPNPKINVTSDVQIDNNYSNNNRWVDSMNTFQYNWNTMPNIPTYSTPQVVNNNVLCVSNTLNFNGYGPQNIPLEFHRVSIGANGLEIYEKGVAPPKKVKFVSGAGGRRRGRIIPIQKTAVGRRIKNKLKDPQQKKKNIKK